VVFPGLLIALLASIAVSGDTPADADLLVQATAAFRQGVQLREDPAKARSAFRQAAELYEQLRQRGFHSAALYQDQGNAYLLASDLPRAILAYRRGLRLAPADRGLRASLEYAREQVVFPAAGTLGRPPIDYRPPWLPRLAPTLGLELVFCFYGLAWVCLTRWRMVRHPRLLPAAGVVFAAAVLLAGDLIVGQWQARREATHPLVVIARDNVVLRKVNGERYPPSYDTPLNRGVEGRRLFVRGDWLQIELAGGEAGWVPRALVLEE